MPRSKPVKVSVVESILVAEENGPNQSGSGSTVVNRVGEENLATLMLGYSAGCDGSFSSPGNNETIRLVNEDQIQHAVEQLRIAEVGKRREAGLLQLKSSLLDALENRSKNKQELHETRHLTSMLEQVNEAADSLLKGNNNGGSAVVANSTGGDGNSSNNGENLLVKISPTLSDVEEELVEESSDSEFDPRKGEVRTTTTAVSAAV